jgi:class 3 adenylate cyclase/CHASE2 domain-containing sensor protein
MLIWTIELGLVLTAAVVLLDGFGALDPLEQYLYDYRARDCQFFSPPPTDRITHVDIDDPSIDEIGRWPWERSKIAEIVDEIKLAGAKLISMDILFSEPENVRVEKSKDGPDQIIEDDARLQAAIQNAGNALLPVSVDIYSDKPSAIYLAVYKELLGDLELDQAQVVDKLRGTALDGKSLARRVGEVFLDARKAAAFDRISQLLEKQEVDLDSLAVAVLPRAAAEGRRPDALLVVENLYPKVKSVLFVKRNTVLVPDGLPPLLTADSEIAIPIPQFSESAAYLAAPEFLPDDGGVVRRVPLFFNYRGRLFPHSALRTACAQLGIDVSQIRCLSNKVILPLPEGGEITIPVHTYNSKTFGHVGMFMNIPWFGGREWLSMYDSTNHSDPVQHVPAKSVWTICEYKHDIRKNERQADDALLGIAKAYPSPKATAFVEKKPETRTSAERWPAIDEVLEQTLEPFITADPTLLTAKPQDLNEDTRKFVAAYRALKQVKSVNESRLRQIAQARAELKFKLSGRAVLMGLTATGGTDAYPTSLHPKCPGVVILGVVANGIINRELWWTAPWWMTAVITVIVGILTTLAVAYLEPKAAGACTIALMAAYFVLNGIVLFDWANRIFGVAAPLTTAFLCWSTLTLVRYVSEKTQKQRITNRFRSYVDPELVNYLMEHIDDNKAVIDGEVRVMTVVFTDLAGFTTISEKLREQTVSLLNGYMSLMLPVIRQNRGFWNKFLGDGIMFFFNAPRDNPTHARDAVATVLEMQKALVGFNEQLAAKELPKVSMRAGISTGPMIVGDAGSTDAVHGASDYTVLGDEVNLGARLESANKYLGSRTLLNEMAAKMCGDEFLLRPMGNLCVVGKTEGVMTFEAICRVADATPEQKRLAELSTKIVEAFRGGDFGWCLEAARSMEKEFGSSKFTELYLNLAQVYLVEPPGEKFDGQIVLSEK